MFDQRSSGILLHISSLPSPGGIGTLGSEAFAFGDFLYAAGQRFWQVLPLGPTGYGDSPYQSLSAFAGNPRFVDFSRLDSFIPNSFLTENKEWLSDFALYMALKEHFSGGSWRYWPRDIRTREPVALVRYRKLLQKEVERHIFLQYQFHWQWNALRKYLNGKGIRIIGDLPIYAALDSADVWASPKEFLLDEAFLPVAAAGVPPDYFSETGQLWGNPLYDWQGMEKDNFSWWVRRMKKAAELFDVVRIDHFRGFESYWAVPWGAKTAINGRWHKGPGMKLIEKFRAEVPEVEIIAEDLGVQTDALQRLLKGSGYPGMRVLQFAFDAEEQSPHLPEEYPRHCVAYTGTHDNDTTEGWFFSAPAAVRHRALKYLSPRPGEPISGAAIRKVMESQAALTIFPLQDILGLGSAARMNVPGTVGGNWAWQFSAGDLTGAVAKRLRDLTAQAGRLWSGSVPSGSGCRR